MKKIICSHGFGVRADGRGLFTDIAAALPAYEFTMFDYNQVGAEGNITVAPLDKQATILNEHINAAGEKVTLLCHSQGCIVASLADLSGARKVIFLAPPAELSAERFSAKFGKREGAGFNPEGLLSIPRRDGTTTCVGEDYLQSIKDIDVRDLYLKVSRDHDLVIIRAANDEILGPTDFSYLNANTITIAGGHDFAGTARQALINKLKELL